MSVQPDKKSKAVAVRPPSDGVVKFDDKQIALLKRTVAAEATNDEFAMFVGQCKRTGLDPFTRQIYFTKGKPSKDGKSPGKVTIIISIDGFRLIAARSSEYGGQTKTEWCGDDGVWSDVWTKETAPAAARVGVHRKGFVEPLYAVALWRDSAIFTEEWAYDESQGKRVKTGKKALTDVWARRGPSQLAKCAEALALRKAFPNELSGLYSPEEMDAQDQTPPSAAIVEAEVAPVPTLNVVMTPDVAEAVVANDAQRASFFSKDAPHENGDAGVPVDLAFEGADAKGTEWDRMVAAAKSYGMTATELEATAKKSLEQMTEAEATRIADRLETLVKQGKKYAAPVVGATPVKA